MYKRVLRLFATLGFSSTLFFAAVPAVYADSISTEGPDSSIKVRSNNNTTVTNNNNVSISNQTTQTAVSGNATVAGNTYGGNATSGNASNSNSTKVNVNVNNISSLPNGGAFGNASTSGPNSPIYIRSSNYTNVLNNNNVYVDNYTDQYAQSGDAKVIGNTHGGNATSGNARNNNDTCVSVNINNGKHANAKNPCVAEAVNNRPSANGQNQQPSGGAGQALGASFTVATLAGGQGAGEFVELPNTGLKDGLNTWVLATLLTLLASAAYWRVAISPKLNK